MITSRIPCYTKNSFDGMLIWFSEMSKRGLLFHPDDKPDSIISIFDGKPFFTVDECELISKTLNDMFNAFGDNVYEAAYPIFMKNMGIQLNA
jgi:hypothetical protein